MDRDSRRMRGALPFVLPTCIRAKGWIVSSSGSNKPFHCTPILTEGRDRSCRRCLNHLPWRTSGGSAAWIFVIGAKERARSWRHPVVPRPGISFPRLFGRQRVRRHVPVNPSGGFVAGDSPVDSCRPGRGGACGHDDHLRQPCIVLWGRVQAVCDPSVAPGAVIEWFPEITIPFAGSRFVPDHGSHIGQGGDRALGTVLPPAVWPEENAGPSPPCAMKLISPRRPGRDC